MKENQSGRVSIDRDRLDFMIKKGFGKPIADKKNNRGWTLAELEAATGINYQTISKIRRGSEKAKEQNISTALNLASTFDVDIGYLTGDQDIPRMPSKEVQEQKEIANRINVAISFIRKYGIYVILDNPVAPTSYSVYDADDRLIEEKRSIEDLMGLVRMIHNLLDTGQDIISLFFGELYITDYREDAENEKMIQNKLNELKQIKK